MKKFIFLLFLFIFFNLFSTTYNTPIINGVINETAEDWDADENLGPPGEPGSYPGWEMWLTWNENYVYLGWKGPVLYPSNNDEILVYIDYTGGGTTSGLYNEQLGFYSDFCITLRQTRENSKYHNYSRGNRDWGTGTVLAAGELEWTTPNPDQTEMRISWSNMTNGSSSVPIPFDIICLDRKNNGDVIALWPSTNDLEEPHDEYYHETGDSLESPNEADILPVCLSTFTVNYINNVSILQWITQTESNNLGWNIYRSISQNLEQVLQINVFLIPGAGTTTQPTEYTFIDESIHDYIEMNNIPSNSTFLYWLESIDYLGETGIYGPITLSIPNEEDEPYSPDIPELYGLFQNYPNPFNPDTKIDFNLKEDCHVVIEIFNTKGELIRTLVNDYREAAHYSVIWDVKDKAGNLVGSGIYLYRMKSRKYTSTRKMILIK